MVEDHAVNFVTIHRHLAVVGLEGKGMAFLSELEFSVPLRYLVPDGEVNVRTGRGTYEQILLGIRDRSATVGTTQMEKLGTQGRDYPRLLICCNLIPPRGCPDSLC